MGSGQPASIDMIPNREDGPAGSLRVPKSGPRARSAHPRLSRAPVARTWIGARSLSSVAHHRVLDTAPTRRAACHHAPPRGTGQPQTLTFARIDFFGVRPCLTLMKAQARTVIVEPGGCVTRTRLVCRNGARLSLLTTLALR